MDFQEYIDLFQNAPVKGILRQLLSFAAWIVVVFILTRAIRMLINRTVKENALRYNLKKSVRFAGYILIILIAVSLFTGNMQYFTVAVGILSAGIAFALQEVILSIAGWISVITSGAYRPGDRIEIGDVKGDVIDIGITKTTLMELGNWVSSDNYTGRIVQVTNAAVFKGAVKNYSADFPFLWDEIDLPLTYDSDIAFACQVIQRVADEILGEYAESSREHWKDVGRKYLIEKARIEPSLSVRLTDNWININLRYIVDYAHRRSTKDVLSRRLLNEINTHADRIKVASATFEIVGLPRLKVEHISGSGRTNPQ